MRVVERRSVVGDFDLSSPTRDYIQSGDPVSQTTESRGFDHSPSVISIVLDITSTKNYSE